MSTVFLFGAGASYGSDTQGTPPLGSALFHALQAFNPDGWGALPRDLGYAFAQDFERAFEQVPPHTLPPLQRAMAAYFFEFVPARTNLYFELAQRLRAHPGWTGAFCTLNYERLLELSLLAAGVQPFIGAPLAQTPRAEIVVPHGCCHLFCEGARGMASAVSFAGFNVQINGPISVISDPEQHRARILGDAFPPVMSYFEPQKRTTAGQAFIDEQRARWRALVEAAATLIIVGVRVRPHDAHVWEPVAASAGRVVYCAGPTAAPKYEAWAAQHRPGRGDVVLRGYFSDEFETICTHAGL